MKRLAIILSLVSLLIGSAVSPAYSVQDKCLTTKKFKEIDSRTLQMMKKNLSKYVGQAFILQGEIDKFINEQAFYVAWYGKGKGGQTRSQALLAAAGDMTENFNRISHLADNDNIKAKVILVSVPPTNEYLAKFSVCSATIIKQIK